MTRLACLALALTALVTLLAAIGSTRHDVAAQAPPDLTGDWLIMVEGDFSVTCTASFTQADTDVSGPLLCGSLVVDFTGTIDLASGSFALSGSVLGAPVDARGTLSGNDEIEGTWEAIDVLRGTFHGTRGVEPPSPETDLSGVWDAEFVGSSDPCELEIAQSGAELAGTLQCGGAASQLIGTAGGRGFTLTGQVLGVATEIAASLSSDGLAFVGSSNVEGGGPPRVVLGVRWSQQAVDATLSGQWNTRLSGAFALGCNTAVQQAGADLSVIADCDFVGTQTLSGTVRSATSTFRISGPFGGARLCCLASRPQARTA